ncbi:MAG: ATP-binding cassette domain-containing protein [Mariprofundus sp.]|nr:ATP-binding cassette domain-containing protein [Mariprofundus sp.]
MNQPRNHSLQLSDAESSLHASAGEIILLTGHAGSGKTLWLKRLAGLIEPPAGTTVTLNGIITKKTKQPIRMLFDRWPPVWLGQTVGEELLFGLGIQSEQQDLEQTLSEWGLSELALTSGLETLNRVQLLRLSLAAISLARPAIALFDNPTSALAQEDAVTLSAEIARRSKQSDTIIVVACNRWHDWRSCASQIWRISSPDALPQPRGQA